MSSTTKAGLFIYAKSLETVATFYESLLELSRLHASDEMVILQSSDVQLIIHKIPEPIASGIAIESPPIPRGDSALKFFFTISSISQARRQAPSLGGFVMEHIYQGPGFTVCNTVDPEGNIFHIRERAA